MQNRLNTSEVVRKLKATNTKEEHAEVIAQTINDATSGLVTTEHLDMRLDTLKSELSEQIAASETRMTDRINAQINKIAMLIILASGAGFALLRMAIGTG